MKEMKNRERFTDKEWEELASILSDEKQDSDDLLGRFAEEDSNNTGKKWKGIIQLQPSYSITKRIQKYKIWILRKQKQNQQLFQETLENLKVEQETFMKQL